MSPHQVIGFWAMHLKKCMAHNFFKRITKKEQVNDRKAAQDWADQGSNDR